MLKGKNIVVCVTGGIAVYKAVDVVSRLKKLGANIDVLMTESAKEFVTPLTFQSMSQNPVTSSVFDEPKAWQIEHIALATKADLFLVVPATANMIGKVANGIADCMISTTIMATHARVVFAPAMNTQMYRNPIFVMNVDKLETLGYEFIAPAVGRLACGDYGEGKLADTADIEKYVVQMFSDGELKGKKVVVSAGPTIEPLDPVRFMTNHSSGKMGYEIAKQARDMGAEVVLVSGPTNLSSPDGVTLVSVQTTREMYSAIEQEFNSCDVLIKAAAPLDYRPTVVEDQKIKKGDGDLTITFTRNPDIVAHFGKIKDQQILVGFAAETENLIQNAQKKIESKNLDFIVANYVGGDDSGFKSDSNKATLIYKNGETKDIPKMTKMELSRVILDSVVEQLEKRK